MWSPLETSQPDPMGVLEDSLQHTQLVSLHSQELAFCASVSVSHGLPLEGKMHNLMSSQGPSSGGGEIYELLAQHPQHPGDRGSLTPPVDKVRVFFPGSLSPKVSQRVEMRDPNSICQKHPGVQPCRNTL